MAAFFAVILILSAGVNIWNYSIVTGRQDRILEELNRLEKDNRHDLAMGDFSLPWPFTPPSREMPYMLRFFSVHFDKNGKIDEVDKDYIVSVSGEDAEDYANAVIGRASSSGYYRGYRYLVTVSADGAGSIVSFLNSEQELASVRNIIIVTIIIAAGSLLAVFLLLLAFSGRAIKPYARNIEAQKSFITDAGHELKTPLTAISTSADVLASEYGSDEWVDNIRSQSRRMAGLINEMVALSRLDEEKPFPDKTLFLLSEAVREISEPAASAAKAKGLEYKQSIEDGLNIVGDRAAVQQAVSVLLDNALKYTDEHGWISLSVRAARKRTEIEVCNSCSDNKDIDTQRVFDRFYRADSARSSSGGYGLGLSIARSIAQRHGGSIAVKLIGDKALGFTIALPGRQQTLK